MTDIADTSPASVHRPQVAGQFYPAASDVLANEIRRLFAQTRPSPVRGAKAIVVPHAGLAFSGAVAASAVAAALHHPAIVRAVIAGPAHRAAFDGIALHPATRWETPLGAFPVERASLDALTRLPGVRIDAAPFVGEHSLEMMLPFLRALPRPVAIVPMLVGNAPADMVAAALQAVWGGDETLVMLSSDLSHFHPDAEARQIDRATRTLIETLKDDGLTGRHACGHRVLAGALRVAQALDMRATGLDLRTSADARGGKDRVVGYGAFALEYAATARLPEADRSALLSVAAAALRHAAAHGGAIPALEVTGRLSPTLTAVRAAFVTLEIGGRLRGCIGSLAPHRSLALDVAVNAVKAGFGDPRFKPLRDDEIQELTVSVSILSHPRPMAVTGEAALAGALQPDVDGLMLGDGRRGALFLPSVWSSLHDPAAFVAALKRKAGFAPGEWPDAMSARRFGTESFSGPLAGLSDPEVFRLAPSGAA